MASPEKKILRSYLRGVHWMQRISPRRWDKALWFLLFLYLVAFPFGQFTRLPLPFLPAEVRIYLTDILVGVIGVVWLYSFERSLLSRLKLFQVVVAFLGAALFSLVLAISNLEPYEILISSLYFIRLVLYFLFAGALWDLVKTKKDQSLVLNSLICVGCAIAIFGWIQYIFYPDLRALLYIGWDEHLNRIVGTFFDPNFTSIILVFTFLLALQVKSLGKLGKLGILGVVFIALLFTYSRSGYLAFLAGAVAYSIILKNLRMIIMLIVLLVGGVFLLPKQTSEGTKLERTTSVLLRVENLQEGFDLFRKNPVFGVGFNTLRYVREPGTEKYGPSHAGAGLDNSFLFVLATTGIVGFVAFVNLLAALLKVSWGNVGSRAIIIPTFVALFTHSMFINSLFYPWVLGWLALLLAGNLGAVKS